MTTDGKLSDYINKAGIEKEYLVQLDGEITINAINAMRKGVVIGQYGKKYRTKSCKVVQLHNIPTLPKPDKKLRIGVHRPTSWISITLTEGKFRQVRKMTAAVGFPTVRLVRIRIGEITLKKLQVGECIPINHLI